KRRSGIGLAVAIGGTLAESVYGGDLSRLRARRKDCPSLRALAAHPRVPFSLTTLHQAIGVYELVQRIPELPATHLTLTHLRLVLPYGDEIQRRLLLQALAEEWNTRQLEQAVRAIKPLRGKGGRPRLPRVVKTLNQLDRIAGEDAAWEDLDALRPMRPEQRAALAAQVARTWFVAVEARRQVDLAQEAETLFQDTADAVRDRFERGQDQGQAAQLRLAETDVATARAARLERQQVLESTVRQLEVLLGRHPGGKMEVPSQLAALPRRPPAGLPSELLLRRPDVVAAERRFAASGRRLLEARRALFPQISLTGGTGTSSGDLADLLDSQFGVWNLAGNLAQPILTGGRLRGEVKVRDAKEKELLESLQQTVLDAFGEVETALAVDPLLAQRQAALQQALELAEQANEAAREEFAGGTGDLLTVFSAQNRLIQLRSQAVTLQRLRLENRINLHLALGGDFELHAAGTGAGE
ncbi:MAG: TolC family protein, partial [Verrucomicrobiales bacterium]|nr:TolC family protein [Verrucomicrobiales bacterium]